MTKAFKEIAIGTRFSLNGNRYRKVSSRTAYMVEANRVFYIGATERVNATRRRNASPILGG